MAQHTDTFKAMHSSVRRHKHASR